MALFIVFKMCPDKEPSGFNLFSRLFAKLIFFYSIYQKDWVHKWNRILKTETFTVNWEKEWQKLLPER